MKGPPYDVVGAAAYAFVALVWAVGAADTWGFRLASRPRNPLSRLLPLFTTAMICFYGLYALVALLLPSRWGQRAPRWFELTDVALLASLAFFRHLTWHLRFDARSPSRTWLVLNYGVAALLAAASVFPEIVPARTLEEQVDSGLGVPPDVLPRLFEPFFSCKPHGTGLGLAIVKRTVEAHGGRVAAVPAGEGRHGMTFEMTLPLDSGAARPPAP